MEVKSKFADFPLRKLLRARQTQLSLKIHPDLAGEINPREIQNHLVPHQLIFLFKNDLRVKSSIPYTKT